MSGAPESAAIEVQHVCLFQELSLGESYLQLAEQHLLKYFNKLQKNQSKRLPTNQALSLINTNANILETTGSLSNFFESRFFSFYSQNAWNQPGQNSFGFFLCPQTFFNHDTRH